MIGRHAPQRLALDVETMLRAAAAAFERGPCWGDAGTLALAYLRSAGELNRRTKPWARLYQQLPPRLHVDAPEADDLLRAAADWGDAEVALFRAEQTPVDPKAVQVHRKRGVALKGGVFQEVDAMALEQYAAAQAEGEREDTIRLLRGRVAAAEKQFEDRVRLCWAAVRNGGRP